MEAERWKKWGISPRLAQVASFFPKSYVALDIGTDHALLPIALTRANHAPAALAADINTAPLKAAQRRLTSTDRVVLIQADGFEALHSERARTALEALIDHSNASFCVTICGVGGKLISNLMEQAPERVTRAVLQPNLQHHRVVETLLKMGWHLEATRLTLEGERLFLTLSAMRKEAPKEENTAPLSLDEHLQNDPLYPLWLWVQIEQISLTSPASLDELPSAALEHWRAQHARRGALVASLSALIGPPLTP